MKAKYKTILPCMIYLVLIFIFVFFLSSIKNHYFVIGKDYIAAEFISFKDYAKKYLPTFWQGYHKNYYFFNSIDI